MRRFDRLRAVFYLGLMGAAGCARPEAAPVVPADAPAVSAQAAAAWVGATRPGAAVVHRFRWQLQDERGAAGGRGTARIAPPDSVRLDVQGPLGAGRGAGVVVGDSVIWNDPPDVLERLVPNFPLMWAMFGAMRLAPAGADLRGVERDGVVHWEWTHLGESIGYRWAPGAGRLDAEFRQAGDVIGRVTTQFDSTGAPATSRLDIPSAPARVSLTFTESSAADSFPPDLWEHPRP